MQQRRYLKKDQNQKITGTKMRRLLNYKKNQKKMRGQINSRRNKKLKARKRKERNKILNEIKELIKKEREKLIEKELVEIESKHADVSKCFGAVRLLKRKKPKLIFYNVNGDMVNTEKQKTHEITKFFKVPPKNILLAI